MATISDTWNSAFEATPAGSDQFLVVDNRIREVKRAMRERITREHIWGITETNTSHGRHRSGSARVYYGGSTPTTRPDGDLLDTSDAGRVYWPSDGNLLVYTGSAFTSLASLSVGGTITGDSLTITSNVVIGDGYNIGCVSDTDLLDLASGVLTVAGKVVATSLQVGGGSVITAITVA
jgi:hypothetical protein